MRSTSWETTIEDDEKKWRIRFDLPLDDGMRESNIISVNFIYNKGAIDEEVKDNLIQDLKDLGKFRQLKNVKRYLEKEESN